jgi:hypothetical protein
MRKPKSEVGDQKSEIDARNLCDLFFVLIQRIIRAWSRKAGSRVIGGRCGNCQQNVVRTDDGLTITRWELAT